MRIVIDLPRLSLKYWTRSFAEKVLENDLRLYKDKIKRIQMIEQAEATSAREYLQAKEERDSLESEVDSLKRELEFLQNENIELKKVNNKFLKFIQTNNLKGTNFDQLENIFRNLINLKEEIK